jgi:hypothetical protein
MVALVCPRYASTSLRVYDWRPGATKVTSKALPGSLPIRYRRTIL